MCPHTVRLSELRTTGEAQYLHTGTELSGKIQFSFGCTLIRLDVCKAFNVFSFRMKRAGDGCLNCGLLCRVQVSEGQTLMTVHGVTAKRTTRSNVSINWDCLWSGGTGPAWIYSFPVPGGVFSSQ